MNRQRVERIRQAAKQDAENLKGLGGDEHAGPATPMEAYRRAGWFASTWVANLCDALLAEDESAVLPCVRCGRNLRSDVMVRPGSYGLECVDRELCGLMMLANWSA